MLEICIPKDIFERMLDQAIAEAPIEACGILAGRDSRVERMYRMINTEGREDHYMMEPREQFAVAKDIRAAGLSMLAIYHSHPATAARPSAENRRVAPGRSPNGWSRLRTLATCCRGPSPLVSWSRLPSSAIRGPIPAR